MVLPTPVSLAGLTDHCTSAQARRLRQVVLRTVVSSTGPLVLVMLVLVVAMFVYQYGWPTAIVAGAVYSTVVVVMVGRIIQTAVPVRRQRHHPRHATYVLQGGAAVIEARITDPVRGAAELANHAKVPGTPPVVVRAMRQTLITAILRTNPQATLRITTRVPALARLYAEDFDAAAETLGLTHRSVTLPVRLSQRVTGLRDLVLLSPGQRADATEPRR
ncbi:hypothetical protein ACFQHV_10970 [Promicromonospora thailandica]